jgi:predicted membrane-bound spermidine synthase
VGTYLPAHLLIEWVGVRATLLVATGLLVLAGLSLVSGRVRAAAAAMVVIVAGCAAFARGLPIRSSVGGDATAREVAVVEERESPYQYVRVSSWALRRGGETVRQTRLSLDEGVLEYHSLKEDAEGEAGYLTGGSYYDHYGLLPAVVATSREAPVDVAILGGGAGTMARMLRALQEARVARIVNVEIDPVVASLSSTFGWTPNDQDLLLVGDARFVLATLDHVFDVIILDAYARQVAIPAHLGSLEFFRLVRDHLSARGVFAMNVSTHDLETPLMRALRRTMGEVFPSMAAVPVPGSWNVVLLAAPEAGRDFRPEAVRSPGLSAVREIFLRGLIPLPPEPSGLLLTDDAAPLEQLARSR